MTEEEEDINHKTTAEEETGHDSDYEDLPAFTSEGEGDTTDVANGKQSVPRHPEEYEFQSYG